MKIWINILVAEMIRQILKGQNDDSGGGEGCLQLKVINGKDQCQACDTLNFFVNVDGKCQKNDIPNCIFSYKKNKCYQCDYGFYRGGQNLCAPWKKGSKLELKSCNDYDRAANCRVCNQNGYISIYKCLPVKKKIRDCTVYRNPHKCQICDLKLPNDQEQRCTKPPESILSNCLLFNHPHTCTKCKPGYKMDTSMVIREISSNYMKLFFHLQFWRERYFDIRFNAPVCMKDYSIENCKELDYDNKCKICNFEYELSVDKTKCFKRPQPPAYLKNRIPNCYKFDEVTYDKCKVCMEKYYLIENNTKCIKNDQLVKHCEIHDQTQKGVCVFCQNQYYLQVDDQTKLTTCILRQKFFNNCMIYERDKDECKECEPNHIFHNDKTACSKEISNCQEHKIDEEILKCGECIIGYYPINKSTVCKNSQNSILGCLKYESANKCKECQQGFYLNDEQKCLQHDDFFKCEILDTTQKNVCTLCEGEGSFTLIENLCTQVETINYENNCLEYGEGHKCQKCNEHYVVVIINTNNKCVYKKGCARVKDDNTVSDCVECLSGYVLYDKECRQVIQDDCMMYRVNENPYLKLYNGQMCQLCKPFYYYKTLKYQQPNFKCIQLNNIPISNCNYFEYKKDPNNNNEYKYFCLQCRRGYAMKNGNKKECIKENVKLTYSYDKLYQYQTLNTPTINQNQFTEISVQTWETDTNQQDQYCYQINKDLNQCLRCKSQYVPLYESEKLENLFTNLTDHNKFFQNYYHYNEYQTTLTDDQKIKNEQYFIFYDYKVKQCNQENDQKFLYQFQYNSNATNKDLNTYTCKGKIKQKLKNDDTEIIFNDSNLMGIYEKKDNARNQDIYDRYYKNSNKRKALCQENPDINLIDNCVKPMHLTSLNYTFDWRMKLSCSQCKENYSLVHSMLNINIKYDKFPNQTFIVDKFNWFDTKCVEDSVLSTDNWGIKGCQVYERIMVGGYQQTICRYCQPKYKQTNAKVKLICPKDDSIPASETQEDNCQKNFKCNEYYFCEPHCEGMNSTTHYCFYGQGQTIAKSRLCIGCNNANQYCQKGECRDKCSKCYNAESKYQCDDTANEFNQQSPSFMCEPLLCENSYNKTIKQRIKEYKEYKIPELFKNGTDILMNRTNWDQLINQTITLKNGLPNHLLPDGTSTYDNGNKQSDVFSYYPDNSRIQYYKNNNSYVLFQRDDVNKSLTEYNKNMSFTRKIYNQTTNNIEDETYYEKCNHTVFDNKDEFVNCTNFSQFHNLSGSKDIVVQFKKPAGNVGLDYESDGFYTVYHDTSGGKKNETIYYNGNKYTVKSDDTEVLTLANGTNVIITVSPSTKDFTFTNLSDPEVTKVEIQWPQTNIHKVYFEQENTPNPNITFLYTIDLNTMSGNKTNFQNSDIQKVIFNKTHEEVIYEPVSGKRKYIVHKIDDKFNKTYDDYITLNEYYDHWFDVANATFVPNIYPEHKSFYKERKDYYVKNGATYDQVRDVEIYKIDGNEIIKKISRGNIAITQYLDHTTGNPGDRHIILEDQNFYYIQFQNGTNQIRNKTDQTYTNYYGDKIENFDGVNYNIYNKQMDKFIYNSSHNFVKKINTLNEEYTMNSTTCKVTKKDNVMQREGDSSSQITILKDNTIYQGEVNNQFYYKKTKPDQSIEYKNFISNEVVTINISGKCSSYDFQGNKYDRDGVKMSSIERFKLMIKNLEVDPSNFDTVVSSSLQNNLKVFKNESLLDGYFTYTIDDATNVDRAQDFPNTYSCFNETLLGPDSRITIARLLMRIPQEKEYRILTVNQNLDNPQELCTKVDNGVQRTQTCPNNDKTEWSDTSASEYQRNVIFSDGEKFEFQNDTSLSQVRYYPNTSVLNIQQNFRLRALKFDQINLTNGNTETVDIVLTQEVDYEKYSYTFQNDKYEMRIYKNTDNKYDFQIINHDKKTKKILQYDMLRVDQIRSKKTTRYGNNTKVIEPVNRYIVTTKDTLTITEDIIQKCITTVDSSKANWKKVEYQFTDYEDINSQNIHIQETISSTNQKITFHNGTYKSYNPTTQDYSLYFYDEVHPAFEAYKTSEYKNSTKEYTEFYHNVSQPIEKIVYLTDKTTYHFRNQSTMVETTNSKKYIEYGGNSFIEYTRESDTSDYIIKKINIEGTLYTYDRLFGRFNRTDGNTEICMSSDRQSFLSTSTSNENQSTFIQKFGDFNLTQTHSDLNKFSIKSSDASLNYELKVDKFNKTVIDSNTKEEYTLTDEYFQIKTDSYTRKYFKKDCRRETYVVQETDTQYCDKRYFYNGDMGFYYHDESLIIKADGYFWINDLLENQSNDFMDIINWRGPKAEQYRTGRVYQSKNLWGQDISMKTEKRMTKTKIDNKDVYVFDDLHEESRSFHESYRVSNSEKIRKYFKNGYYEFLERLTKTHSIKTNDNREFKNVDGLLTADYYGIYTITKNNENYEKKYQWHPFIKSETYNENTKIKTVEFHDRYKEYYNISKMVYENDQLKKVYNKDSLQQIYDPVDKTLKYIDGSITKYYSLQNNTVTYDTNNGLIKTTEYLNIDKNYTEIEEKDSNKVIKFTRVYDGYKDIYELVTGQTDKYTLKRLFDNYNYMEFCSPGKTITQCESDSLIGSRFESYVKVDSSDPQNLVVLDTYKWNFVNPNKIFDTEIEKGINQVIRADFVDKKLYVNIRKAFEKQNLPLNINIENITVTKNFINLTHVTNITQVKINEYVIEDDPTKKVSHDEGDFEIKSENTITKGQNTNISHGLLTWDNEKMKVVKDPSKPITQEFLIKTDESDIVVPSTNNDIVKSQKLKNEGGINVPLISTTRVDVKNINGQFLQGSGTYTSADNVVNGNDWSSTSIGTDPANPISATNAVVQLYNGEGFSLTNDKMDVVDPEVELGENKAMNLTSGKLQVQTGKYTIKGELTEFTGDQEILARGSFNVTNTNNILESKFATKNGGNTDLLVGSLKEDITSSTQKITLSNPNYECNESVQIKSKGKGLEIEVPQNKEFINIEIPHENNVTCQITDATKLDFSKGVDIKVEDLKEKAQNQKINFELKSVDKEFSNLVIVKPQAGTVCQFEVREIIQASTIDPQQQSDGNSITLNPTTAGYQKSLNSDKELILLSTATQIAKLIKATNTEVDMRQKQNFEAKKVKFQDSLVVDHQVPYSENYREDCIFKNPIYNRQGQTGIEQVNITKYPFKLTQAEDLTITRGNTEKIDLEIKKNLKPEKVSSGDLKIKIAIEFSTPGIFNTHYNLFKNAGPNDKVTIDCNSNKVIQIQFQYVDNVPFNLKFSGDIEGQLRNQLSAINYNDVTGYDTGITVKQPTSINQEVEISNNSHYDAKLLSPNGNESKVSFSQQTIIKPKNTGDQLELEIEAGQHSSVILENIGFIQEKSGDIYLKPAGRISIDGNIQLQDDFNFNGLADLTINKDKIEAEASPIQNKALTDEWVMLGTSKQITGSKMYLLKSNSDDISTQNSKMIINRSADQWNKILSHSQIKVGANTITTTSNYQFKMGELTIDADPNIQNNITSCKYQMTQDQMEYTYQIDLKSEGESENNKKLTSLRKQNATPVSTLKVTSDLFTQVNGDNNIIVKSDNVEIVNGTWQYTNGTIKVDSDSSKAWIENVKDQKADVTDPIFEGKGLFKILAVNKDDVTIPAGNDYLEIITNDHTDIVQNPNQVILEAKNVYYVLNEEISGKEYIKIIDIDENKEISYMNKGDVIESDLWGEQTITTYKNEIVKKSEFIKRHIINDNNEYIDYLDKREVEWKEGGVDKWLTYDNAELINDGKNKTLTFKNKTIVTQEYDNNDFNVLLKVKREKLNKKVKEANENRLNNNIQYEFIDNPFYKIFESSYLTHQDTYEDGVTKEYQINGQEKWNFNGDIYSQLYDYKLFQGDNTVNKTINLITQETIDIDNSVETHKNIFNDTWNVVGLKNTTKFINGTTYEVTHVDNTPGSEYSSITKFVNGITIEYDSLTKLKTFNNLNNNVKIKIDYENSIAEFIGCALCSFEKHYKVDFSQTIKKYTIEGETGEQQMSSMIYKGGLNGDHHVINIDQDVEFHWESDYLSLRVGDKTFGQGIYNGHIYTNDRKEYGVIEMQFSTKTSGKLIGNKFYKKDLVFDPLSGSKRTYKIGEDVIEIFWDKSSEVEMKRIFSKTDFSDLRDYEGYIKDVKYLKDKSREYTTYNNHKYHFMFSQGVRKTNLDNNKYIEDDLREQSEWYQKDCNMELDENDMYPRTHTLKKGQIIVDVVEKVQKRLFKIDCSNQQYYSIVDNNNGNVIYEDFYGQEITMKNDNQFGWWNGLSEASRAFSITSGKFQSTYNDIDNSINYQIKETLIQNYDNNPDDKFKNYIQNINSKNLIWQLDGQGDITSPTAKQIFSNQTTFEIVSATEHNYENKNLNFKNVVELENGELKNSTQNYDNGVQKKVFYTNNLPTLIDYDFTNINQIRAEQPYIKTLKIENEFDSNSNISTQNFTIKTLQNSNGYKIDIKSNGIPKSINGESWIQNTDDQSYKISTTIDLVDVELQYKKIRGIAYLKIKNIQSKESFFINSFHPDLLQYQDKEFNNSLHFHTNNTVTHINNIKEDDKYVEYQLSATNSETYGKDYKEETIYENLKKKSSTIDFYNQTVDGKKDFIAKIADYNYTVQVGDSTQTYTRQDKLNDSFEIDTITYDYSTYPQEGVIKKIINFLDNTTTYQYPEDTTNKKPEQKIVNTNLKYFGEYSYKEVYNNKSYVETKKTSDNTYQVIKTIVDTDESIIEQFVIFSSQHVRKIKDQFVYDIKTVTTNQNITQTTTKYKKSDNTALYENNDVDQDKKLQILKEYTYFNEESTQKLSEDYIKYDDNDTLIQNTTVTYRNNKIEKINSFGSSYILINSKAYSYLQEVKKNKENDPVGEFINQEVKYYNIDSKEKAEKSVKNLSDKLTVYTFQNGTTKEYDENETYHKYVYPDSTSRFQQQIYRFVSGDLQKIENSYTNGVTSIDYYSNQIQNDKIVFDFDGYNATVYKNKYEWQIKKDNEQEIYITKISGTQVVENINDSNFQNKIATRKEEDNMRVINYKFSNSEIKKLDQFHFIFNGCWDKSQYCSKGVCYDNVMCNCDQDQVCMQDDSDANNLKNICVNVATCNDCKTYNQFCQIKNLDNTVNVIKKSDYDANSANYYTQCMDQQQQSSFTETCNGSECTDKIQVSGKLIYAETPCYYMENRNLDSYRVDGNLKIPIVEDFTAVHCSEDQECKLFDSKRTCVPTCKPECESGKQECVIEEEIILSVKRPKAVCKNLEIVERPEVVVSCEQIPNCQESVNPNSCDKCENKYSIFINTSGSTPQVDNQKCVRTDIDNCHYGTTVQSFDDVFECVKQDDSNVYSSINKKFIEIEQGCDFGYTYGSSQCTFTTLQCKDFDQEGNCKFCSNLSYDSTQNFYSVKYDYERGECQQLNSTIESTVLTQDFDGQTDSNKIINCRKFHYLLKTDNFDSTKHIHDYNLGDNVCIECKDGYFLNNNNYCIKKDIENCEIYDTSIPYHIQQPTGSTTPQTVFNKCQKCNIGYRLIESNKYGCNDQNKQCCVSNTPSNILARIPECIAYDEHYDCLKCSNQYTLRKIQENGALIDNTKDNTANKLEQKNFCYKITPYTNCREIDEEYFEKTGLIKCKVCNDQQNRPTYPKKITDPKDYINSCVQIKKRPNCEKHVVGRLDQTTYECSQCNNDFFYLSNSFPKLENLPKIRTDNLQSTDEITQTYILENLQLKVCKQRENLVNNCEVYYIDADQCKTRIQDNNQQTSNTLTDLSNNLINLLNNAPPDTMNIPKENIEGWIMGCEIYADEKTCHKCYSGKYLDPTANSYNTICQDVQDIIPFCRHYSNAFDCEECNRGYLLDNNKCLLIKIENCSDYIDNKTCRKCSREFPIMDMDSNCIKVHGNTQCLRYMETEENQQITLETFIECEICNPEYYPDNDGYCVYQDKIIDYCKYYLSEYLCRECQEGSILSWDFKRCELSPQFDQNCQEFERIQSCSLCEQGYYLNEKRQCEECKLEGCAYCDPLDTKQCLLCKFGYTMNTQSECSKNKTPNDKTISPYQINLKEPEQTVKTVSKSWEFILTLILLTSLI